MRRRIVLGCLGLFPMLEAAEAISDPNERLYKPFKCAPKQREIAIRSRRRLLGEFEARIETAI